MGAGHNHADSGHGTPGHNHAAGANARNLAIALAITSTFLVAELVGSFVFNSLALLSDAAHMLTDARALAVALVAIRIGRRCGRLGRARLGAPSGARPVGLPAGSRRMRVPAGGNLGLGRLRSRLGAGS